MAAYIPLIYFLLVLAWAMIVISFKMKDFPIMLAAGLFMMILGVWVTSNGLDDTRNLLSLAVGLFHLGIGGYVAIRSSVDKIQQNLP